MFKNLWYRVFGYPTTAKAVAGFQKVRDDLNFVISAQTGIKSEQQKIAMAALELAAEADTEITDAEKFLSKLDEWFK